MNKYEESVENIIQTTSDLFYSFGEAPPGSEASREISKYIGEKLEEYGLEASKEKFEVMAWLDRKTTLSIISPEERELAAVSLPYSPSADNLVCDLVYVGTGLRDEDYLSKEIDGKAVLAEWDKTNLYKIKMQYLKAVKNNASVFIVFDAFDGQYLRRLVITATEDFRFGAYKPLSIPALTITREDGLYLLKLMKKNKKVRIKVNSEIEVKEKVYDYNVIGTIRGDENYKGIILTAHYDHWLASVSDNLTSVALLLELARTAPKNPVRTLKFVFFGAEEGGGLGYEPWYWINGSRAYVKSHKRELDKLLCALNFDPIGRGKVTTFAVSGSDLRELLEKYLRKLQLNNSYEFQLPWTGSDHYPFLLEGIPVIDVSTRNNWEYYHSNKDVPETLNKSIISDVFKVISLLIAEISTSNEFPLKPTLYVNSLIQGDEKLGLIGLAELQKIAGASVDLSQLISKIITLYDNLTKLHGKNYPQIVEHSLISMYRILNETLFSVVSVSRSGEEELEWVSTYFPNLQAIRDLANMRIAIELLDAGMINDAIMTLSKIPVKRKVPGTELDVLSIDLRDIIDKLRLGKLEEAYVMLKAKYDKLRLNLKEKISEYEEAVARANNIVISTYNKLSKS